MQFNENLFIKIIQVWYLLKFLKLNMIIFVLVRLVQLVKTMHYNIRR